MRQSSRIERRVSFVLSDATHTLQLVEQKVRVRFKLSMDGTPSKAQVDIEEAERALWESIKERELPLSTDSHDVIGVLVSLDIPFEDGRIVWAEDDEVAATERKLQELKAAS